MSNSNVPVRHSSLIFFTLSDIRREYLASKTYRYRFHGHSPADSNIWRVRCMKKTLSNNLGSRPSTISDAGFCRSFGSLDALFPHRSRLTNPFGPVEVPISSQILPPNHRSILTWLQRRPPRTGKSVHRLFFFSLSRIQSKMSQVANFLTAFKKFLTL